MKKFLAAFAAVAAITGGTLVAGASSASAHAITCHTLAGKPYRTGSERPYSVGGYGRVDCDDIVDGREMIVQLQIYEGKWRNYGNPTETHNRGMHVSLYDGAPCKQGINRYRLHVKNTGRHHNTQTKTVTSESVQVSC
ncbi:hypothetical protein [Kineosporia babensis]|uniref:Secreted protein n=1 Tax=Kineosporia babensis TaxID=499548 RepID=A0A9X1T0U7_9ACTN|nr:hypothetical protein [Kineosporia babensis]MCD5313153.1 hypothetical protein [Kineosporia babensis]